MNNKRVGDLPLFGRLPKNAEWRLLERLSLDMSSFIDQNDLKVIRDICQKRDFEAYLSLDEYWGLHSIDPSITIVGTRDACLYQLASLLRKQTWSTTISEQQILNATLKFRKYETHMRQYNRVDYRKLTWSDDHRVNMYVSRMQSFIASVLDTFSYEKVFQYAKHGPGGTFGLASQKGHRYYKYATLPYEVTSGAINHARRFIKHDERWVNALCEHPPEGVPYGVLAGNDSLFQVVPGNRIEFVPKETDEARTIALEASMNVLLQLGVDGYVRKRLLEVGIDINDQSINQALARLGSIDNSLSTLDLKGASDNISLVLIEKLFPYEWMSYLFDLRSDTGTFPDGSAVCYEKLSSMGNGYTFAIETLVFAAAVYAVNPDVSFGLTGHVYGDDIIVETKHVTSLIQLLGLCGFSVNSNKSFFKDTFTRESCGTDFYRGRNIRPVFLKLPLESLDVFAFYSLHNKLCEWFSRILHEENPSTAQFLKEACAPKWRLYGPPSLDEMSAYLCTPLPQYGRTPTGLYRFDRAIAVTEKFEPAANTDEFQALCHDYQGDLSCSTGGSRYTITKRSAYSIRSKRRAGRAFAWPYQHYAV